MSDKRRRAALRKRRMSPRGMAKTVSPLDVRPGIRTILFNCCGLGDPRRRNKWVPQIGKARETRATCPNCRKVARRLVLYEPA